MFSSWRRAFGFTLLELIVVIVILGILAAVAVPTYDRVRGRAADETVLATWEAVGREALALAAFDGAPYPTADHVAKALADLEALSPGFGAAAAWVYVSNPGQVLAEGQWSYTDDGTSGFVTATPSRLFSQGRAVFLRLDQSSVAGIGAWDADALADGGATGNDSPEFFGRYPDGGVVTGGAYAGGGSGLTTSAYRDAVLALNPVAYWRLGESSGTTAVDETGNGYDGSFIGNPALGFPSLITGDQNTAVNLDGVDDYVDISSAPRTSSFTYMIWFQDTAGDGWNHLITSYVPNKTGAYISVDSLDRLAIAVGYSSGVLAYSVNSTLTPNTTYMAALTYDANTRNVKVYLNGNLIYQETLIADYVPSTASDPFRIGASASGSPPQVFKTGPVDEVAIWSLSLSPSDIQNLYNVGSGN